MAKKKGTEKVTTLILGEENILTTKAVGEEVPMTTVAIGEEDKNLKEKERFTTLALVKKVRSPSPRDPQTCHSAHGVGHRHGYSAYAGVE
jgi:hypothetical protein